MKAKLTLFAALLIALFSVDVQAQNIYALQGGGANLVKFPASDPSLTSSTAITGVSLLGPLVSIDFRPATGELYGMGYNNVTTEIQLYTIDTVTAVATPVGTPATLNLTIGGNTAFDFNPTVDRIRVITDADSNFRLNPVNGQLVSRDLNIVYAAGDVNAGANPGIMGVAYTNSYDSAATTTLYGYDHTQDVLVTINPPNNGTLNTVGASGRDFNVVDLDISADNIGYMIARGGVDSLYTIDLSTGAVTPIRYIGTGLAIQDIAVWISGEQPVGIRNVANDIEVSIYPNPATDNVQVKIGTAVSGTTTVRVTDISGREVSNHSMPVGSNTLTVDMSAYTPGMYYISVENTFGRTVKSVGKY